MLGGSRGAAVSAEGLHGARAESGAALALAGWLLARTGVRRRGRRRASAEWWVVTVVTVCWVVLGGVVSCRVGWRATGREEGRASSSG